MNTSSIAILFSGGTDSLALYAMAVQGNHERLTQHDQVHLMYMLNGMSRFPSFPRERFNVAKTLLGAQFSNTRRLAESHYVELDCGRLFQGLWLDRYEELMPRYNGKNLVCVACKVAMHIRAIIYCIKNDIPAFLAGYTKKQSYYPEQTPTFMSLMRGFSNQFGVDTLYPVFDDFTDDMISRHYLEDQGLPSTGGGERKCLFSQTYTTATEEDTNAYLSDMLPRLAAYITNVIDGKVADAARCFLPGRVKETLLT